MAGGEKRIVFMGTPEFARIVLNYVLSWPWGKIVGVYTQPDRPRGRDRVPQPSPVKELARDKALPVYQPQNFKSQEEVDKLGELEPDYLVVAAYGLILPQEVLQTAREMPLNVHASLLPLYRGAAPIQRAIINGEEYTGISIMHLTPGMDSGPVLMRHSLPIEESDTAQSLHDKLASLGGELLLQTLDKLQQEGISLQEQDSDQATYAPKLQKEEGEIDWNLPAREIHNRIRGMFPWPGAYFDWNAPGGKALRLIVYPGKIGQDKPSGMEPGTIAGMQDEYLCIACRDKMYLVPWIKPVGGKEMSAHSFYCGFLHKYEQ